MTFPGNEPFAFDVTEDGRYIPEHLVAPEPTEWQPAQTVVSTESLPLGGDLSPEAKVAAAIAKATAGGLAGMSPADRIAALSAIRDAIDGRVKWEKQTIIENLLGAHKAQSIPSALGNLSFKPETRPVKIDEEKLLAYVREIHPEQISERVVYEIDPEFRKLLVSAVVDVADGDFALSTDGTPVDFAYLGEPIAAQIAYPASSEQKIVKAQARQAIDDHFMTLASGMLDAAIGGGL